MNDFQKKVLSFELCQSEKSITCKSLRNLQAFMLKDEWREKWQWRKRL